MEARVARQERRESFMAGIDFARAPFSVVWEVTQACPLVCRHCRAEAQPRRNPDELTVDEARDLIDEIAEFGNPIFVLTGGDPLARKDLPELAAYSIEAGLRTSLAPSVTPRLKRERIEPLRDAGVARIALSLDGAHPEVHDGYRGVAGSFERTLAAFDMVRDAGFTLQINSTISRQTIGDFEELLALVTKVEPIQWSVFFLVPVGRGQKDDVVSPEEHEAMFERLWEVSRAVDIDLKVTAAQPFRRVAITKAREAATAGGHPSAVLPGGNGDARLRGFGGVGFTHSDGMDRPTKGVNDGNGFLFISHIGEICPSGFLPLSAGNVREDGVVDVYRNSELFVNLRDSSKLKGKCGMCEFADVCGGSRARSWALTGDELASDPTCVYLPAALREAGK